jgi:hypothetical protein
MELEILHDIKRINMMLDALKKVNKYDAISYLRTYVGLEHLKLSDFDLIYAIELCSKVEYNLDNASPVGIVDSLSHMIETIIEEEDYESILIRDVHTALMSITPDMLQDFYLDIMY